MASSHVYSTNNLLAHCSTPQALLATGVTCGEFVTQAKKPHSFVLRNAIYLLGVCLARVSCTRARTSHPELQGEKVGLICKVPHLF